MSTNLPFGNHFLSVESIKQKGMRITFVMRPVAKGYSIVLRTWTFCSPAFETACLKFGVKEVMPAPENLKASIVGRLLWAEIGPAKNPEYVDLKRILSVPKDYPAKEVDLYLKGIKESSYRKNTNDEARP